MAALERTAIRAGKHCSVLVENEGGIVRGVFCPDRGRAGVEVVGALARCHSHVAIEEVHSKRCAAVANKAQEGIPVELGLGSRASAQCALQQECTRNCGKGDLPPQA